MQLDRFECRVFAGWRQAASALPIVESLRRQAGLSQDMTTSPAWFVSRTAAWRNSPVIVLLEKEGKPVAAALFYSRSHFGIPTGVVKGGNNTGDGLVVAPTNQRVAVLQAATQKLLSLPWVHTVAASLRGGTAPHHPLAGCVWRSREINTHLSLEGGFEGFLSRQRPRSRRNYRYFRRRAERELGLVFVPHLQMDDAAQAVAELHAASPHPIPRRRSIQLEAAIRQTPGSFAMGVRNPAGQWLSYVSGWRQADATFLEWQLNSNAWEAASLSTVMRTYFLEHEAANGITHVVFVGGSSAALGRYCDPDTCLDLLATRQGIPGLVARRLVGWLRPGGRVASLMRPQDAALGISGRDAESERGMAASMGAGHSQDQLINRSPEAAPAAPSSAPARPSPVRPLMAKLAAGAAAPGQRPEGPRPLPGKAAASLRDDVLLTGPDVR